MFTFAMLPWVPFILGSIAISLRPTRALPVAAVTAAVVVAIALAQEDARPRVALAEHAAPVAMAALELLGGLLVARHLVATGLLHRAGMLVARDAVWRSSAPLAVAALAAVVGAPAAAAASVAALARAARAPLVVVAFVAAANAGGAWSAAARAAPAGLDWLARGPRIAVLLPALVFVLGIAVALATRKRTEDAGDPTGDDDDVAPPVDRGQLWFVALAIAGAFIGDRYGMRIVGLFCGIACAALIRVPEVTRLRELVAPTTVFALLAFAVAVLGAKGDAVVAVDTARVARAAIGGALPGSVSWAPDALGASHGVALAAAASIASTASAAGVAVATLDADVARRWPRGAVCAIVFAVLVTLVS